MQHEHDSSTCKANTVLHSFVAKRHEELKSNFRSSRIHEKSMYCSLDAVVKVWNFEIGRVLLILIFQDRDPQRKILGDNCATI